MKQLTYGQMRDHVISSRFTVTRKILPARIARILDTFEKWDIKEYQEANYFLAGDYLFDSVKPATHIRLAFNDVLCNPYVRDIYQLAESITEVAQAGLLLDGKRGVEALGVYGDASPDRPNIVYKHEHGLSLLDRGFDAWWESLTSKNRNNLKRMLKETDSLVVKAELRSPLLPQNDEVLRMCDNQLNDIWGNNMRGCNTGLLLASAAQPHIAVELRNAAGDLKAVSLSPISTIKIGERQVPMATFNSFTQFGHTSGIGKRAIYETIKACAKASVHVFNSTSSIHPDHDAIDFYEYKRPFNNLTIPHGFFSIFAGDPYVDFSGVPYFCLEDGWTTTGGQPTFD